MDDLPEIVIYKFERRSQSFVAALDLRKCSPQCRDLQSALQTNSFVNRIGSSFRRKLIQKPKPPLRKRDGTISPCEANLDTITYAVALSAFLVQQQLKQFQLLWGKLRLRLLAQRHEIPSFWNAPLEFSTLGNQSFKAKAAEGLEARKYRVRITLQI